MISRRKFHTAAGEVSTFLLAVFSIALHVVFAHAQDYAVWNNYAVNPDISGVFRGSDTRLPLNDIQKRIWFNLYGNFLDASSENNNFAFSAKTFGLFTGTERRFGRFTLIGGGIGADWTSVDQSQRNYGGDISALKGFVYTQFTASRWYCDLEAGFGTGRYELAQSGTKMYSTWNNQWNVATEIGVHWEHGLAKTEPFFALNRTELDDFDYNNVLTTAMVGCRYNWRFAGPLAIVRPGIFGGYLHQFDEDLFSTGSFVSEATVFRMPGVKPSQNRFFLGMNLVMSMRKSLDLYVKYTTELSNEHNSHTIFAGMNWNF